MSCLILTPGNAQNFAQTGIASFYADKFVGRTTANGEKYKHSKLTAAHRSLPFGTLLKVTNLENGKEVIVRVNDRGPFVKGRIIDLSKSAAKKLGYIDQGVTKVKIITISSSEQQKKESRAPYQQEKTEDFSSPVYYAISAKAVKPRGFGVQRVGFTKLLNLVELAEDLQKKYIDRIFIQTSVVQNVKYYKIIIENETTKDNTTKL